MTNNLQPLSVGVMPLETRRDAILHLASRADELGYDAFSLAETWSYDSTLLLTEIALQTQQIRLLSGILGVWGRSAATIAMASATINEISNGRFMLGLGSSSKQLTEGLHDVPYKAPYKQLRKIISQVRALLKGERIPLAMVPEARPLRLNLPTYPDIPILLGGSAPRSVDTAGELCDGWLPFLYPRDHLPSGITRLQKVAARAGRSGTIVRGYPVIPTVVAEDPAKARQGAAWFVAFYLMMMGPLYKRALVRLGYEKEVEAVLSANASQKPAIVPPEAEALLEQLTIYGTPQEARRQLALWYDAGAHMPGLALAPNLKPEEMDYILSAFRQH